MSIQIQCPHFASIAGMYNTCLDGRFPVDCTICTCKDKQLVEVTTTTNTSKYG